MSVQKQIDALLEEAEELSEVKEDLFNAKADMTITAVGMLLKTLDSHITDMGEIATKQKEYDENLILVIKGTLTQIIDAFSKMAPPQIQVNPTINMDLKALEAPISKLTATNETLIQLANKLNNNPQHETLAKLIISILEKQNNFFDKEIKQMDYTELFKGMKEGLNKKAVEFKSEVTKYGEQNRIKEITTKVTKFQ